MLSLFIMLRTLLQRVNKTTDKNNSIADKINILLPQTQCGKCGYAGCYSYAEAIVKGEAINKCPPG